MQFLQETNFNRVRFTLSFSLIHVSYFKILSLTYDYGVSGKFSDFCSVSCTLSPLTSAAGGRLVATGVNSPTDQDTGWIEQ